MKLAEVNHASTNVKRRLQAEYWRLRMNLVVEEGDLAPGGPTLADLEQLLRRKRDLKLRRVSLMAEHPALADLLARRTALRVQSRVLRDLRAQVGATLSVAPRFDPARLRTDCSLRWQRMEREWDLRDWRAEVPQRALKVVPMRRRPAVEMASLQRRLDVVEGSLSGVECTSNVWGGP